MISSLHRPLLSGITILGLAVAGSAALAAPPETTPGQSATLLPDGRQLVLGGDGSPVARRDHTATVLPDGRVLVWGGIDASGEVVARAEVLDPATMAMSPLAVPGLRPRAGHTATVLMDGRVLLLGGTSSTGSPVREIEIWDPKTGSVEALRERVAFPRSSHGATVLASGGILITGGRDERGASVQAPELFLPDETRFATLAEASAALAAASPNGLAPEVAAALPVEDAEDVALDAMIAVRFSKPLRVEALGADTVTLHGPGGATKIRIVPVEAGMLLFVTPTDDLFPGSDYTLFIEGAVDPEGRPLPFSTVHFRTRSLEEKDRDDAGAQGAGGPSGDPEVWNPEPAHMRGDWRVRRPDSPFQQLPALTAAPGVTALAGQVLLLSGDPAAEVTMSMGGRTTRTDATGRFLLEGVPSGMQTLVIDGGTASRPGRTFGYFESLVWVAQDQTTALRYTIWMPRINTQHAVTIASPTNREVVVTSPHIPGLELHIPPGVVLRDREGRVVHEISITPIPVDRPPFPLPSRDVPVYFTIQPGGVRLQSVEPEGTHGAWLVYPNYTGSAPGTELDFWNYDPFVKSWYVYGHGRVGADGRQVVPDYGVAIYEFTGAMVSFPGNAPPEGPPPGGCEGEGGDPVSCSTGLFLLRRTDLGIPGTIPLSIRRTYRPKDTVSRAFGIGTSLAYDVFTIGDIWPYTYQDLILPDGGRVHFVRTSPGTSFGDAIYEHTSSPTEYHGAVISYTMGRWRLRLKNGTEMYFSDCEGCTSSRAAAMVAYKDRWGSELTLQRDANRNLTRVTSPDGKTLDFTYDASNRVTQARDIMGRTITYQYDASGRLWKVTNPEGGVEEYGYDASNRMTTVKKPGGTVMVTNVYDANGRVTRQTLAGGAVYEFAYTLDGSGRVIQSDMTNPRGNVRRLSFNAGGYVTGETLALGTSVQRATSTLRSASTNLASSTTDALGRVTSFSYDTAGNALGVTRLAGTPGAFTESFTYGSFGQVASFTDGLGHLWQFGYDALGNGIEMQAPFGASSVFTYDGLGRPLSAADPDGNTTAFEWEAGDLAAVTDPLGRRVTLFTDAAGRTLSMTDPLGNRYRYEYDRLDRLTKVIDPLGKTTTLVYDAIGNLTTVTDAKGGVTRFTYDAKDRVATMVDPLNKTESYVYDASDNVVQLTERNGKITTYTYDAIGRLTSAAHGRTKQGASLTAPDATVTYTWDAADRLVGISDSQGGSTTLAYDDLDRLTSETTAQGTINYTYDAADRLVSAGLVGQPAVTYTYDAANRLTGVTRGASHIEIGYDSDGRTDIVTFANGIVADYGYDDASQLTSITYSRGATVIGDLYYEYDVTGRRVKVAGSLAQVAFPSAMSNATYDAANRLTSWAGTSLTYDLNGNLTNDGARTFTWDSRNRMKTIAGAATASFGYDGLSRRTSTTVSGASKSFVYDDLDIVAEIVGGAVSATSVSGLGLDDTLLRTDSAGERTPLVDALGSTIALTDPAGTVRTSYRYEPYGTTTASGDPSGNPVQFTGRENDGTGLYYYRSRYYNPAFGRFVAEDPLGLVAGMNLYGYVDGDPISFVDPLGLNACKIEYLGYPITIPGTSTQVPLGHAGVLSYDPVTGDTRYYEYGRYGDDFGSVERREVPDLDIDPKTGKPTPESWKKLKDYLRKKLGKGKWMTTLCDDEADFDKVNDFAEKRMHDPNRKPYEWNPLKGVNQCFSFADEAIKAGRAGKKK